MAALASGDALAFYLLRVERKYRLREESREHAEERFIEAEAGAPSERERQELLPKRSGRFRAVLGHATTART